jgi:hypothetical protein
MNTRILWALLCLLTFGARAQTPITLAQETFEGGAIDYGYASTTFASNTVEYFERRAFNADGTYPGTTQALSNRQGSYTWVGEGVRGTGATTTRSAGYVVLNPINVQNYKDIKISVAFAAPRGGAFAGAGANSVAITDRIRIQYSFGGGPFVTAGLLLGNNGSTGGDFQQDMSSPLDSIPDAMGPVLDQQFRDITVSVPATGSSLRVRVVLDMRSVELTFDNIRVTGVLDNAAKPTLSSLESTSLTYTEGGAPVQLTNTLQVGYSDNSATLLTGATVKVTNYIAGQDVLNFTNQPGITGSYSTSNGTLTLSGTASQAAYQAALRSVAYVNNNSTTANGVTRQIEFQGSNGAALSNTVTRNVAVTLLLNSPAPLPYTETFDTEGENTRYFGNSFYNANSLAGFFRATTNPPTGTTTAYSGTSGSFWYGEGTTLGSNPTAPLSTLQLAPVNASGYNNLRFTIALGKGNSWKTTSFLKLYSRVNGGSWVLFGAFYGNNATGEVRRDNDLNGVADAAGTSLTAALQDIVFDNIPNSAAVGDLDFKLEQRGDVTEEIAFDNIRISAAMSPTVTTSAVTNLTPTSATLGGTLTSDGGSALTDYGVVYVAGTGTPTISDTKVTVGTNSPSAFPSAFAANVTGLAAGTTYTVRAYATSSAGTSYGSAVTFTTSTTVVAISAVGASPTNASSVAYTVTFATSVSGLTASNFSITSSGLTGVSLSSIVGTGTTYTVRVNTGNGSGTLALNLANTTGLAPRVANVPFNGQVYTIDKTVPTATLSSATASGGTPTTSPLTFTATFSESVTGFSASGISVTNGSVTSGPTGSGTTYTFQVTPTTPNAVTTITISASAAQDVATNGNTASSPYSLTYTVTNLTWTGSVSTDWFTASNWSPSLVPTANLDVVIPASASRFPTVEGTAQPAITRSLTINSGATLAMSGNTLDVHANLTNNGSFLPTGGTVVLGTTAQTNGPNILGSSSIRFWNLTVNANGLLLSTSAGASVQRVATLNGSFVTQGNSFTLESNATGTAMLVNNGSNVIIGNVTVQRYLSAVANPGLGYRHFSAPTGTATVGSLATGAFTPVVNPVYNTSAQPGTVSPFPTVYGYDQSRLATGSNNLSAFDKGWFSPSTLGDPLNVGQGYTVNLAADQTVSFTGPQNNADSQPITLSLSRNAAGSGNTAAAGWALVGNPFPSPLDYSLVAAADRAGLDPAIYVFESNGPYTGSYRANLNGVGGNGSSPSALLATAQGFFVRVSDGNTAGTLTFRNSQRLTDYASPSFLRTTETRPLVQLTLQGSGALTDETYVYFEKGATDGFEPGYDAVKLPNSTGLNLSASHSGKQLAIDGHAELGAAQRVVPLAIGVPTVGSYTLTAKQLLNLGAVPTYLRDLQTGALINLAQQASYQFTVSDASTLHTGRFELVFSPQQVLAAAPAALGQQVALYPNPATSAVALELPASLGRQAVTATLLDALGREVRTITLPAQGTAAHQLDLHQLVAGVYALRLHTSAGIVVRKLVIE